MLLNFPLEIIHIISSHLKFKDKLKLKTTCRKLNEVITKAVLYEKLDLLDLQHKNDYEHYGSSSKAGDRIVQKLINNGFDGSLVKELQLDINKLSDPILSQISNIFPNVQRVITKKDSNSSNPYVHARTWQNASVPLSKWRNTINKIVSLYDWDELKWDVFFSKYPRLTELDLDGLFSMLNLSFTDKKVTFFSNAPLLTTLTLRFGVFNLKILEAIHTGFPLLVTLRLFRLVIKEEMDNSLPSSIVPANKLTYLGFLYSKNVNTNGELMYYITKKYPNLKTLVVSVIRDEDYFIKTRDDVKVTRLNIEKDSEKFTFNQMAISNEHFLNYNSMESVFFSNLPKSLKTLTLNININNVKNALEALAKSDVNIRVLNLVDNNFNFPRIWKDPNMLNHFRNLTSLTTLKITLDSSVQTFALECVSFSITKLYINLCGHSFSIEWVLSVFPLLEELYINPSPSGSRESDIKGYHGGNDRVTEEILPRRQYQNLRIINMKRCFVYSDFFDFMKMAVPNLFELDLTICFSSSSSPPLLSSSSSLMSLHYDLSNWTLNKCHLGFVPYHYVPYVYCTITIQNVSKWFVVDYVKKCLLLCNQDFREETSRVWLDMKLDHINQLTIAGVQVV